MAETNTTTAAAANSFATDAATGSPANAATARPLIEFSHIKYGYSDALALDDVSFTIDAGEMIALTGPNGSGKSTALRLMNGLAFASSGEYRFDGELIAEKTMKDQTFAKHLHQRLGFVFQNPDTQLFCPSVREEIAFGPRQMGLSEEEVARRVDDMLALFRIESMAKRAPYNLSGGEKRKVAIACIVSMNPDAIILDEPWNALDEWTQEWLSQFLNDLHAVGKTIIVTTHHRDIVSTLKAREIHIDRYHHIVAS